MVDGQQRLTTLQLLIDAIQEVLEERGQSDPAMRLAKLVANDKVYRSEPDHAFKVWPTAVDRDAFRHAMRNDLSATDYAASRIVQAHEYFKGQAGQWLDRFPDEGEKSKKDAALALESAVSVNLAIVVIDLGKADDPHVIFETLNARGTPLLQSDMVKNKILHETGIGGRDDDSEASEEEERIWPFGEDWWTEVVGRGRQKRPRIDQYLNHWLTLRNLAEMKQHDEFRAFEKYAEERTIQVVAEDLGEIGRIYRDVEEVRRPDIARFLERRNVMTVGQVTPLLLWLLSADVPTARLANCLLALESFLVRRVVCRYSARSYGDLFVRLVAKLAGAEDSANNADRILVSFLGEQTAQAALWPGDEELRERFMTDPLYGRLSHDRLVMVLTGIEEELRTNKAESREVPDRLHIEHVMPQAWHSNWPLPDDVAGDGEAVAKRDRVIHTIGNLTLVNKRLNSAMSNAPWDRKRKTLANHSVLFLNKRLVNEGPKIWDEEAIKMRARWLHERAVKIWPHKGDIKVG